MAHVYSFEEPNLRLEKHMKEEKKVPVPEWFPYQPPIYDIERSYSENASFGPFYTEEIPKRDKSSKGSWTDFLGHHVMSPIGVPAGPLLNSKWISLAAKLGFDILTYKTIRSFAFSGHKLPNMIYVKRKSSDVAVQVDEPANNISDLTLTNSFGMPSKNPEFIMQDIEAANKSLAKGQVMIISVVGSHNREIDFVDDFVTAAQMAKDAGAKIIEANFSCPNVNGDRIYIDPKAVATVSKRLVEAIAPIPLIIKVGVYPSVGVMRDVFLAAAGSGVRAICGLNTISMKVENKEGNPALDDERLTSGICGGGIRKEALDFVSHARQVIKTDKLDLTLMGCGGAMLPEHFDQFLKEGADIAMTATGMMWDPYLALRYHRFFSKEKKE